MKIIFLDIDGTVLSHTTNSIPSSTIQAINEIRNQGVIVFGCTGRHALELEKLPLENLNVDGWITMNGAYNYLKNGTVITHYPIASKDILVLYDALKNHPFPVQFLEKNQMYMNMHDNYVKESLEKIHSKQDPIQPLDRILNHPIYMFIPWIKKYIFDSIQKEMKNTTCVRWNEYAIDCFHEYCGKQRGVEDILSYFGISKEEAGCVGDADNDLSMFESCGHCVAMGNATESLKEKAEFITSDIDDDGLKKAIKYLVK